MAHKGFVGAQVPMSNKQCVMAYDFHKECLSSFQTANDYICPDTFSAYKRWCPENVRQRHRIRDHEEALSRSIWTQQDLNRLNSS